MSALLAARTQMAMSLAFHILFAVVGICMPLLMTVAEGCYLRTRNPVYLELARRWSKGTAIMFAVGAVSGTVLSFELGLLWPGFMAFAGPIIGMPFSLEGFAFFLEAIFLGIYLYGWDKLSPQKHFLAGIGVFLSGTLSGIFVVTTNAWMNTPAGFTLEAGKIVAIDPFAAMLNPSSLTQVVHMTIASFAAVGMLVAGIHAWLLLKDPSSHSHRLALGIALAVGGLASVLEPISGDFSAKHVAATQPVKLAAMEAQWETERSAPLRIGGWPDESQEVTRYSLEIPGGLSFLSFGDFQAEVKGLKAFPVEERPPVAVVHLAFQLMVGAGSLLMGVALLGALLAWRQRGVPRHPTFLKLLVLVSPLGLVALEAGWVVTEVGRQPWIIRGIMRTAEAVTPMPYVAPRLMLFTGLYLFLGVVVILLLRRQVFHSLPASVGEVSGPGPSGNPGGE